MRKNSSSSKSNKTIKRSHLFVEGRDDDNEYKHVDIENIGKREDIQLGACSFKSNDCVVIWYDELLVLGPILGYVYP